MSTTVEEIKKTEIGESKSPKLLLDSLEIKGYRCFEHLKIEKLGRVNLIVGKNNVGKTALLEALWVLVQGGDYQSIGQILQVILHSRNEIPETSESYLLEPQYNDSYKHLFYKRPNIKNENLSSTIGTFEREITIETFDILNGVKKEIQDNRRKRAVELSVTYKGAFDPVDFDINKYVKPIERTPVKNLFVRANGESSESIPELWDEITLTDKEDLVIDSLNLILNEIISINLIGYPKGSNNRIPVARSKRVSEPVPLKSFGEGMNRLLGIALALVNCKDGILLIDEIEIGLHYSVLPDVWKLIFKTAKDLNVQVFATTHSKDCVEAFAQIANENDEKDDGMLIRLERHGEKIVAKTINEDRLAQAVNHDVEVR